jgi:hypothetical protein
VQVTGAVLQPGVDLDRHDGAPRAEPFGEEECGVKVAVVDESNRRARTPAPNIGTPLAAAAPDRFPLCCQDTGKGM